MSLNEILGWGKQLLDTFGLTNFITAGVVVAIAAAIFKFFRQ